MLQAVIQRRLLVFRMGRIVECLQVKVTKIQMSQLFWLTVGLGIHQLEFMTPGLRQPGSALWG